MVVVLFGTSAIAAVAGSIPHLILLRPLGGWRAVRRMWRGRKSEGPARSEWEKLATIERTWFFGVFVDYSLAIGLAVAGVVLRGISFLW